jgi:hypothetical protein
MKLRFLTLILALSLLPACGLLQNGLPLGKRKGRASNAMVLPKPVPVGTIVLVNEESKFVLIDGGDLPSPGTGAPLKSYTAGVESGSLLATEVRKRPHIIADIKAGAPRKGDRVEAVPVMKGDKPVARAQAVPNAQPAKKPWWKLW